MSTSGFHLSDFKTLIAKMPTDYHSSRAKHDKKWKSILARTDAAGEALRSIFGSEKEVSVSRADLRVLAKEDNLEKFVMATLLWGYPNGMRGKHVQNICDHISDLTGLLKETRATGITNWKEHWKQVKAIKGVALSTYTKFLSFIPATVNGHCALILDRRVNEVAKRKVFVEFVKTFSEIKYPKYLERMYQIAGEMDVPAENLEFFLFLFGPDLKQTEETSTS